MVWCTYPRNETLVHQQLSLHQLHHSHPSQRLPTNCVRVNESFTKPFRVSTGLRQGCVLSPILFNLFVNDLPASITATNEGVQFGGSTISSLQYADDLVMIADSEQALQTLLGKVHEWCSLWSIKVNSKVGYSPFPPTFSPPNFSKFYTRRTGYSNLQSLYIFRHTSWWSPDFPDGCAYTNWKNPLLLLRPSRSPNENRWLIL